MADVLQFDPATEFEILETIEDFEEQVQRPEELRFFTLDEQLTDFFEKMLPQRKATRFELKQLERERERIRIAYEKVIRINNTEYIIDTERKSVHVDWIHPIYSDFVYKAYSWDKEWKPILEDRRTPVYYPRMITALPRPYVPNASDGRPVNQMMELVNGDGKNPVRGLGLYERSKMVYSDDGTTDVVKERMLNTSDDLHIIGYHLDTRPYELANPLADHPFLKSIQPSKVITQLELNDVFPSIPAIIDHAVPITNDPYGQGMQYLKLYDVKLSQIPWTSWKSRFPPVPGISAPLPVESISFPKHEKKAPGERLTKTYTIPWYPGYHTRKWLDLQVDSGEFVSKLVLTSAGDVPLMPATVIPEGPPREYPAADPSICESLSADFDTFLNAGLYRNGTCVPVGMIQKEQEELIAKNRIPWKETQKEDILREYEQLLAYFQTPQLQKEENTYMKVESLSISERRKNVLAILGDDARTPDDKADAIEILTRDLEVQGRQYLDAEGLFVVCMHTLAELRGELEEDRLGFYAEWAVVEDGKRVCKSCGDEINNDVIVAKEEYDEDGHLVMTYERLPEVVHHGQDPFGASLLKMKGLFDLENGSELVTYTLLSLLQVVPQEEQLLPILQWMRRFTASLKARRQAKESQERVEGIMGLAGTTILLLTHSPFLIPKRSFNGKTLKMSGFPRDSENAEEMPLVNGLAMVIKHVTESYPGSFKSAVFKGMGKYKTDIIPFLTAMAKQFRTLLDSAKERYDAQPISLEHMNDIVTPLVHIKDPFFRPGEEMGTEEKGAKCEGSRTSWMTRHPPILTQAPLELVSRIEPSPYKIDVDRYTEKIERITLTEREIRDKIKLGVPAGFPIFTEFVRKEHDGAAYIAVVSRCLDIVSKTDMNTREIQKLREVTVYINTQISPSLLRDAAKGLLFETLHAIKAQKNYNGIVRTLLEATKRDLVFRMMFLSKEAAEKEDTELIARERLTLKQRYREMNDTQREATNMLIDIGVSEYIITNEDRERFAQEFRRVVDADEVVEDEEGYTNTRDYVENGDQPLAADGTPLEVDYGDYGDRAVREYADYGDYGAPDMGDGDGF